MEDLKESIARHREKLDEALETVVDIVEARGGLANFAEEEKAALRRRLLAACPAALDFEGV